MKVLNQWAVVTGASKGLGYSYCQELLKKGYHILGVSRNVKNILVLQKQYPGLEIRAYDLDLSSLDNVYKLYDLTKELNVTVVINNAGYGILGKFQDGDLDAELNMLHLNIDALHILTKLFTQRFLRYNYGRVINISSCAAFIPGPGFASYYASKAYVLQLSTAINYELIVQKSKVRVLSICPGPLKTDFWNRAKSDKSKQKYKSGIPVIDVDTFASKSLKKALKTKKKNYILIGFWNRLMLFSLKILPKCLSLKILYKYQVSR
ncbi:MAG: SDR family NAD(P)-dependent oxidoreductase [Spiroplasma sp.]